MPHVRIIVVPTQLVVPAVHARFTHVCNGLQYWLEEQSASVTHSTQYPTLESHTWFIALHCRDEVHASGDGMQ